LSTKVGPVGRDLRGLLFFRSLNFVIVHHALYYAPTPQKLPQAAARSNLRGSWRLLIPDPESRAGDTWSYRRFLPSSTAVKQGRHGE
jgi:hypothetical protein